MIRSQLPGTPRWVGPLLVGLTISLAACGGGSGTAVETNVVELDAEGASVLSAEMAACVRQTADVEITDDFLVVGERIPLDMDVLPPDLAQTLVACIAQADAVPDAPTSVGG